jgi:2-phosphosulfolactate phosphatase
MNGTFVIDYLPESASRYVSDHAIVAVDVIRATTMAVTAVAEGRACYTAASIEEAYELAGGLVDPILAGEIGGIRPSDFDMNNSPAELLLRPEKDRPLILLSSSGTRLLHEAKTCAYVYVACLRNYSAVARYVAVRHDRIALIGAGSRGQFREEDQLCCAWLGRSLIRAGYTPENKETANLVTRLGHAPVSFCALGESAAYLERTGQLDDLDFVLLHVDDIRQVFVLQQRQILSVAPSAEDEKDIKHPAAILSVPATD